MTRFTGRTALVTGAAGGSGAAIVRMLRAEGARVAVVDRDTSGIEADVQLPGDLTDAAYADGLPGAALAALVLQPCFMRGSPLPVAALGALLVTASPS